MTGARGGRARTYASNFQPGGWKGEHESWIFFGAPENPHPIGTTLYSEWQRSQGILASRMYTQSGLEQKMGCAVPNAAWDEAKKVLSSFVMNMQRYEASHANKVKSNPKSFPKMQEKWAGQLGRMLTEIGAMTQNETLRDIWENYQEAQLLETKQLLEGDVLHEKLLEAFHLLNSATAIIERAVPLEIKLPHEATTRRQYGAILKKIAAKHKIDGKKFVEAFNIYADVKAENGFNEWYQSLNQVG